MKTSVFAKLVATFVVALGSTLPVSVQAAPTSATVLDVTSLYATAPQPSASLTMASEQAGATLAERPFALAGVGPDDEFSYVSPDAPSLQPMTNQQMLTLLLVGLTLVAYRTRNQPLPHHQGR
jgi:hypothetical protein